MGTDIRPIFGHCISSLLREELCKEQLTSCTLCFELFGTGTKTGKKLQCILESPKNVHEARKK